MKALAGIALVLVASSASARPPLDQTSRRLEAVLEHLDNASLANADEHRRNAEWFKWARTADEEKKKRQNLAAYFQASTYANSWPCPINTRNTDGCATATGVWTYTNPTQCWTSGGALQGNLTFYSGFTRPPWNVPGCDYGIGANVTKAQMLANPSTYDPKLFPMPTGCTYTSNAWPFNTNMDYINCTTTGINATFHDLYLGAAFGHAAVGISLPRGTTETLQNVIIDNNADIGNVTKVGGFTVGQIYLPTSAANFVAQNVTAFGNFNDGSGCCDTPFGAVFQINTSGSISFDQVVMQNFQQYEVSITGTGHTLSITHSVIDSCQARTPIGHTECWAGATNYGTGTTAGITYQYNVFRMAPAYGNHEEFLHITSTGSSNPVNGFIMDHNVEISNPTSPAAGAIITGVQFQLINGTFTLTAAFPASISYLTTGTEIFQAIDPTNSTLTNTVLSLWQQNGSNAYGPTFQTDCGSAQSNTVWCPTGASTVLSNYNNTTTVAATTGGKLSTNTFNFFHDWSKTPMTGVGGTSTGNGVWIHDNYAYLGGVTGGWQNSPSDCTGITNYSSVFGSNNINLLDGSNLNGWTSPGTGC